MKSNEIRNGVYYSWRGGDAPDEGYVQRFGITDWTEYIHYPERFRPVPITNEWLENFGFEKHPGVYFRTIKNGSIIAVGSDGSFGLYRGLEEYMRGSGFNNNHRIKWVHELQNLVHSLTGEELKIKEDGS